jgi:hypothetical protein
MRHDGCMASLARSWGILGLLLAFAAGIGAPPVAGQPPPAAITTDTPQYCLQLLDRLSQLMRVTHAPPPDVTSLSTEGQRMCGEGQTRGGILRLRRALVLLRDQGVGP